MTKIGLMQSVLIIPLLVFGCSKGKSPEGNTAIQPEAHEIETAIDSVNSNDLLKHIRVLASDEYEGRAPGTRGEELTVNYLVEQFKETGLKPGNPDGTFAQKVPLVGFTGEPKGSFTIDGRKMDLRFPGECVAVSRRFSPEVRVEGSDVVFVGYGIVAPEYGCVDYKGLDV